MKFRLFGSFPVVKELREIRGQLTELQALLSELKELKHIVSAINGHASITKEAAIVAALDNVLMTAPRYADPKSLAQYQAQVYSQNAEDGIIAEIFHRIGTTNKFFVEIGVEDGIENNTRFPLQMGWTGVWLEGDPAHAKSIRDLLSAELRERRLTLVDSFVTKENVKDLLETANVPAEFDLLSIDIDMNTHHVWESLSAYRPRVACIEYNASFPPSVDYCVPYNPTAIWADASNYYGAGLKALERIGRSMGYNLVGCDYLGVNAFFVRDDLCENKFLEPHTAEFHYEPPRYALLSHRGHKRYKSK